MPEREVIETVITLRREFPQVGVIAISGNVEGSSFFLKVAGLVGVHHTLSKPFTRAQLSAAVASVLQRKPAAA